MIKHENSSKANSHNATKRTTNTNGTAVEWSVVTTTGGFKSVFPNQFVITYINTVHGISTLRSHWYDIFLCNIYK